MSTQRISTRRDRAIETLRILGVSQTEERLEKVGRFIGLLGWDRIRSAAAYTAGRRATVSVGDPWFYTVGVVNQVSARAAYLYTLFHWIELALRASLDVVYSERFGPEWHLMDPPEYLDRRTLGNLWKAHEEYQRQQNNRGWTSARDQARVKWRQDVVTTTYLPDYDSPEAFLAVLDFQTVTEMVLHAYTISSPKVEPVLFTTNGNQMPLGTARAELQWLRTTVRNSIAHNRPEDLSGATFDIGEFVKTASRTERLLAAVNYNAPFALTRHEQKHMVLVDEGLIRLGTKGLHHMINLIGGETL